MAFSDIAATALPVIGGVVGSVVPGLGTAAGSAIGSVLGGIAQTSSANRKEKDYRAKDAAIPLYDPMQMSYLDKVQRMQRSFQAGADPMTAYQTRLAREGQANVLANLNRAGGGSSANIQNSMARTLAPTANAIQGAGAAASRQALSLLDMEGGLIGNIEQRVRRRQVEQRDMAMAEYARSRQDANNAMMAGLALLPDVKFGGPQRGPMTTPAAGAARSAPVTDPMGLYSHRSTGLPKDPMGQLMGGISNMFGQTNFATGVNY